MNTYDRKKKDCLHGNKVPNYLYFCKIFLLNFSWVPVIFEKLQYLNEFLEPSLEDKYGKGNN